MASSFAVALSAGLTGRGHIDADSSYPELLGALSAAAGSKAAAARALGVSPTTFYRWTSGRSSRPGGRPQQPKVAKSVIVAAARARQLANAGIEQDIRSGALRMRIRGLVIVSGDDRNGRPRTIHPGRDFPPRVQGAILDAWLKGDDDHAEDTTFAAIERYYVPGMDIDEVHTVEWEQ